MFSVSEVFATGLKKVSKQCSLKVTCVQESSQGFSSVQEVSEMSNRVKKCSEGFERIQNTN